MIQSYNHVLFQNSSIIVHIYHISPLIGNRRTPKTNTLFQFIQFEKSCMDNVAISRSVRLRPFDVKINSLFRRRLVARGHNVSMYTMVHRSIGKLGVGIVNSIESIVPYPASDPDDAVFNRLVWIDKSNPYFLYFPTIITMEYFQNAIKTPEFSMIANEKWDLVICDEMFGQPAFAIALMQHQLHATPFIMFKYTIFYIHSNLHLGNLSDKCQ